MFDLSAIIIKYFYFPAKQFLGAEAKEMGTVCDMTLSNIVDLYLFDDQASVVYQYYPPS